MPLDKMPDSEEFMATHKSVILHVKGTPVACIIDENSENILRYDAIKNDASLRASLVGFLGMIFSGLHLGQIPGPPTSAEFCVSLVSQLEQNFMNVFLINLLLMNI